MERVEEEKKKRKRGGGMNVVKDGIERLLEGMVG